MFQRNALAQLHKWAAKDGRKPLILRGARQVGKTTLVDEFSKEFDTYLYLNLEDEQAAGLFDTPKNIDDLLVAIYLYCNKPRNGGRTLLFIDEIQNSVKAVARLRYFYEAVPEMFVIAAGSLLESLIDTHISFPVGRVEYMAIRPCSFDEFLGALGEVELQQAIAGVNIPEVIHPKVMGLFNTYTLIGGMPEVVKHYVNHKDLVAVNDVYETLLSGYRDDVEKYARNQNMTHVIRYILQTGWSFAAQIISLGSFAGSSYKAREMGEAFRTLEKTMLLELVYPSVGNTIPIVTELRR
ncbi:MAG: AAA family ATPase, partial [Bacteroidota bacterium]|nr:AAA family ATPase [Bacteroidota bacterium]